MSARRKKKTVVHRLINSDEAPLGYMIWCEGCGCGHAFYTERPNDLGARWTFNGDMEAPTFTPSMLVMSGHRCHSFVTAGRIQYLDDSTHALRGQTVPLKPF